MNELIRGLGREALRQLFGLKQPRNGKIVLTRYAFQKMTDYKLDRETLENAFRHGKESRRGKITHKYTRYSVGLYYIRLGSPIQRPQSAPGDTFLITTCWKGR